MTDKEKTAPFVGESLRDAEGGEATPDEAELQAALSTMDVPIPGLPSVEQLLGRVAAAPLRYAPFFGRVADMFEVPEDEVERLLGDEGWTKAPLPGLEIKEVDSPKIDSGQSATLVRFAEGMRYPKHSHESRERVLILEGGYTDVDGHHYEAGDVHEMAAGTEHSFVIDQGGPCVAATIADTKVRFSSWWLRALGSLIGR